MSNGDSRGFWEERVVPRLVDATLRGHDVERLRDEVCGGLSGQVLEIGFGSGLNSRWYPAPVTAVDAVEPSDLGWRLSEARRELSPVPVSRVGLDGQRLAAESASYDAVLSTFTLCSIPDVGAALGEARRVLRPGGTFHFLEHGLAPTARVRRWQRRMEPLQKRLAGGCHLTRDIEALVGDAGLRITGSRSQYLPGPGLNKPWTYVFIGRALLPH